MATTTNFGWETPDDTDLVKDGALAMRTLGNAIDTSLVDLKGGTTGQVLSKTSNTDMDFTWSTPQVGDITSVGVTSPLTGGGTTGDVTIAIQDGTTAQKGAVQLEDSTSSTSTTKAATPNSVKSAYDLANAAIPKSLVDAAGDIIYATADNTVARLGIGTAGQVLKVNSGATAPEWGAASSTYTWTNYTPTWTNLTVGNGTVVARYLKVDKLMTVYVRLTFGSTTSITGAVPQFTVPEATTTNWQYTPIFLWQAGDYGTNSYAGSAYFEGSTTKVGLYIWKANATYISTSVDAVTSTVPHTWTTNDTIGITFTYEVA